jgi:hypothetical protein
MRRKATLWLILLALAALIGLSAGEASAVLYTFDSDPPPDWGNEQGKWIASGGEYYASDPWSTTHSYCYSFLPFDLTNFTFEVELGSEQGIFLTQCL